MKSGAGGGAGRRCIGAETSPDFRLEVIATDTLTGLGRLERLRLSSNRISTLEFGSFSHLESVQKVDLQENPLTCDCHLAWILDYMDVAGAKARYHSLSIRR